MTAQETPYQPPLSWRLTSAVSIGLVGSLSHGFLYGLNRTEVHGLDRFLKVLDSRKDETARTRGLITVSNHVSVIDDPLIWGVLPIPYLWNPNNTRWSLASYDICFKSKLAEIFFSYGNTLPTHRAAHSKYGGLFQPTMTQVIRLLSDPHGIHSFARRQHADNAVDTPTHSSSLPPSDPFSSSQLTYTTTGTDSFPAPSAYPYRRFGWVHIFPEGMIHQHPDKVMRYFKWGVARLILEAEPCPDVLAMWVDGPQQVMNEKRTWPRPLPRAGNDISVTFGELVDTEAVFEPFRKKWREMKARVRRRQLHDLSYAASSAFALPEESLGDVHDDELKYGVEAEELRIALTLAVRNEVLKVRRARGLLDEDPKRSLAETFRVEGGKAIDEKSEKKDGSVVRDG